jgi:hypothetical protein
MKFCWAQYLLRLVVAVLGLVIAVLGAGSMMSACGQKGKLVRPAEMSESTEQQSH